MKTPKPAALRESIRIEREENVHLGGGVYAPGWATHIEAQAARITPVKGNEVAFAEQLKGVVLYEVAIRESTENRTITAGDRAVNTRTGEVFDIKHPPVNPDERGRFLTFQAQVGTAA